MKAGPRQQGSWETSHFQTHFGQTHAFQELQSIVKLGLLPSLIPSKLLAHQIDDPRQGI